MNESNQQIWRELSGISEQQKYMLLGKILTELYSFQEATKVIKAFKHASNMKGTDRDIVAKQFKYSELMEVVDKIHHKRIEKLNQ